MKIELNNRDHCDTFVQLNEQWISHFFKLEEADHQLAANPYKIVENGGCIFSLVDDDQVVGVCALFKDSEHRFQLARMAVDPAQRGKGYGDVLIQTAQEKAKAMGADSVYLLSNTVLAPAIALYRKHGFETLTEGPHPVYARCNIVMEVFFKPDHAAASKGARP
jgi:N-acetylglutamate synthase-like GNAT family acetyltransferase